MPKKLLLADDSVTIQKMVAITFATEDYVLTMVDNGEEAIVKAREMQPDIIIADTIMPEKNGYEVSQEIKSDPNLNHIRVLLLAGTSEAFDDDRARVAKADGHIQKPFETQALIDRVFSLLSNDGSQTLAASSEKTGLPGQMSANVSSTATVSAAYVPTESNVPTTAHASQPQLASGTRQPTFGPAIAGASSTIPQVGSLRPPPPGIKPHLPSSGQPQPNMPPTQASHTVSSGGPAGGFGGSFGQGNQGAPSKTPSAGLGSRPPPVPGHPPSSPPSRSPYQVSPEAVQVSPRSESSACFSAGSAATSSSVARNARDPFGFGLTVPSAEQTQKFSVSFGSSGEKGVKEEPISSGKETQLEQKVPFPGDETSFENLVTSADSESDKFDLDFEVIEDWIDEKFLPSPSKSKIGSTKVDESIPTVTEAKRVVAGTPKVITPTTQDRSEESVLKEALSRASRELIERIAWEVVPQLAETIIREELERLLKERETKA